MATKNFVAMFLSHQAYYAFLPFWWKIHSHDIGFTYSTFDVTAVIKNSPKHSEFCHAIRTRWTKSEGLWCLKKVKTFTFCRTWWIEHRRLKLFEFKLQSQYFSFSIYFERASRSLNMKLCGTWSLFEVVGSCRKCAEFQMFATNTFS